MPSNPNKVGWLVVWLVGCLVGWLFGWLVGFYGKSTFVGYLTPNPFYVNNQSYFKQFSLA